MSYKPKAPEGFSLDGLTLKRLPIADAPEISSSSNINMEDVSSTALPRYLACRGNENSGGRNNHYHRNNSDTRKGRGSLTVSNRIHPSQGRGQQNNTPDKTWNPPKVGVSK